MINTYTAKYTKISSGYIGQLIEWPEVITEGKTLEVCREMLADAAREMIKAYRKQKKEIPTAERLSNRFPSKSDVSQASRSDPLFGRKWLLPSS